MKKEIKTTIGVIIGAVFGYFIIQLFSGANSSTSFNLIGFTMGALFVLLIISIIKYKLKKVEQEND